MKKAFAVIISLIFATGCIPVSALADAASFPDEKTIQASGSDAAGNDDSESQFDAGLQDGSEGPSIDPDDVSPDEPSIDGVGLPDVADGVDVTDGDVDGLNPDDPDQYEAPEYDTDLSAYSQDAAARPVDGFYQIESAASLVLDVAGASLDWGANVQAWQSNSTLAQIFKIECNEDGLYMIYSAVSGLALDVEGGSKVSGTNVRLWEPNGSEAQLWKIIPVSEISDNDDDSLYVIMNRSSGLLLTINGHSASSNVDVEYATDAVPQTFRLIKPTDLIGNGTYTIYAHTGANKVLDIACGARHDGANAQLWSHNATLAQKWAIENVGNGDVRIRNINSGGYLSLGADGNVFQWHLEPLDYAQVWSVSPALGGYTFVNVKYGQALDVSGASGWDGANIQGYGPNDSMAQVFRPLAADISISGMQIIRNSADNNVVMDISGGSNYAGANVQGYWMLDSGVQKWEIIPVGNGYCKIKCAQNGLVLDVVNGVAFDGANVHAWYDNDSHAQRWRITDAGVGGFYIRSALDESLALTFEGGLWGGANVRLEPASNWVTQFFCFDPTYYEPLSGAQKAMRDRINGHDSSTEWLLAVDCSTNRVGVFHGSKGYWCLENYWSATTGAWSSPTIKGVFTIKDRGMSFGEGYTCWYWTQISGNYLFHSILYNPGSMTSVQDGRLGINASHGCIRLALENARWINRTIPRGTKVIIW